MRELEPPSVSDCVYLESLDALVSYREGKLDAFLLACNLMMLVKPFHRVPDGCSRSLRELLVKPELFGNVH